MELEPHVKTGLILTFMSGKYTRFTPPITLRASTFLIKRDSTIGLYPRVVNILDKRCYSRVRSVIPGLGLLFPVCSGP